METYELKRLWHIRGMIRDLERRLAELRRQSEVKSPGGSGVHTGPGDPVGRMGTELAAVEEQIERAREQLLREERRLVEYINGVDDLYIRRILWLRYVDGESWAGVAYRMGGRNTPDGVRKAHIRWLRKVNTPGEAGWQKIMKK